MPRSRRRTPAGSTRCRPTRCRRPMSSTASANVAQVFGIEGTCYSPSSACTTSALAIGQAMQLIQTGRQDIVLAGGSEALHDNMTLMFDAMGALSRRFNETPQLASRPYDTQRGRFRDRVGRGSARARGTRPRARARRAHLCRTDRLRPLHRRGGHDRAACAGNRAGNAGRARRSRRRASRLRQRARAVHAARRQRGSACDDGRCSASACRRSRRPSALPGIRSVRAACTRRSMRF